MRKIAALLIFGLVITNLTFGTTPAHAQREFFGVCPYKNGAYYQPLMIVGYDAEQRQLITQNYKTRAITIIDSGIDLMTDPGSWSPDCHYYTGQVGNWDSNHLMIWDLLTGKRFGVFGRELKGYDEFVWANNSQYMLVQTLIGEHLWKLTTGEQIRLNNNRCGFRQVYFDYPQNQVLTVDEAYVDYAYQCAGYPGGKKVVAYDLTTGKNVAEFDNPSFNEYVVGFEVSPDTRTLFVYGEYGLDVSRLSIWDRDTMTRVQVNSENSVGAIALSLDKRYLTLTREFVRVWDLWNLAPNVEDRKPIYRILKTGDWQFVGSNIIQMQNGERTRRFDLTAGNYIE